MTAVRIRVPDDDETGLSPDEMAVAIREGFHAGPGLRACTPIIVAQVWRPVPVHVDRRAPMPYRSAPPLRNTPRAPARFASEAAS